MKMRIILAMLAMLAACGPEAEPGAAEVAIVDAPPAAPDGGEPAREPVPEWETEAWLSRHGPTFDRPASPEYLARYPSAAAAWVSVADMLAQMADRRANPVSAPEFEWPVEERVDLSRTTDPALALTRVTWSEEGIGRPESSAALWQVVRAVRSRRCDTTRHGQRVSRGHRALIPVTECRAGDEVRAIEPGDVLDGWEETELSSIRRLSRFVTGMAPPHRQRVEWLSTLVTCDTAPARWRECADVDGDGENDEACDGTWAQYADRCADLYAYALAVTTARRPATPCRGRVMAWGGEMDRPIMARRNEARVRAGLRPLLPVDCGDVKNTYYGYPDAPELHAAADPSSVVSGQVITGSPSGLDR